LVIVEQGVFAFPPVLVHDPWGRWMAATLTAPGSVLSHESAGAAWGFHAQRRAIESVTRPGSGGPVRHGRVLVFRSSVLDVDVTALRGIRITAVPRTLLDLAPRLSDRALARAIREAIRLQLTSIEELGVRSRADARRGSRRLGETIARYSGLPLHRARSGAEIRGLEILRDAGFTLPRLNVRIAGEEADLSWPGQRLIVEIDGGPFHLDAGEDERKERRWTAAGWTVVRIPADVIHDQPQQLIELAHGSNVARATPEGGVSDVRLEQRRM
jgi:very-short-patch-repair endonuclease